MKQVAVIAAVILSLTLYSCGSKTSTTSSSSTTSDSSPAAAGHTQAIEDTETYGKQSSDTTKLQSEVSDMINSITSGKPDTTKLKHAAAGIITTDAAMLSDSGIDKMYGDDPAANQAASTLKGLRNKMGLTPGKLDSMKKAAAELRQGTSH